MIMIRTMTKTKPIRPIISQFFEPELEEFLAKLVERIFLEAFAGFKFAEFALSLFLLSVFKKSAFIIFY